MGIKSKVDGFLRVKEEREYPYIGDGGEGVIVLMHKEGCGVVLVESESYAIGYYTNRWDESTFTLYKGSITLENT